MALSPLQIAAPTKATLYEYSAKDWPQDLQLEITHLRDFKVMKMDGTLWTIAHRHSKCFVPMEWEKSKMLINWNI